MSSDRLKVISGGDPFDPPTTAAVVTPLSGTPAYRLTLAAGRVKQSPDNVRWLRNALGAGPLSWAFLRNGTAVRVSCIGESGYVEPVHADAENGPATVAALSGRVLSTRISDTVYCYTEDRDTKARSEEWFPVADCERALDQPDLLPHLRPLRGVTHTPVLRADSGILDQPGYDTATGYIYRPDVDVPDVPAAPTASQLAHAVDVVRGIVSDFVWVGPHHEANYLGALLTPLVRLVCPGPYKLVAIGAHQRGSGKSLLAKIPRILHGGTLRTWPTGEEELAKQITSVLTQTTAPICVIDNVRGIIRSGRLEALLTTRTITDRVLGTTNDTAMVNDRLWVLTGNNVALGGDLDRRTLWAMIDPGLERPEDRSDFRIPDLTGYVTAHRGTILQALLTVLAAWDAAGRPTGEATADDYGQWVACLRGILDHAGVPGVFDHPDSREEIGDPEEVEFGEFLATIYAAYGTEKWTVAELAARMRAPGHFEAAAGDPRAVALFEAVPTGVAARVPRGYAPRELAKPLGYWIRHREGRWFDGRRVVRGVKGRDGVPYRVETADGGGRA